MRFILHLSSWMAALIVVSSALKFSSPTSGAVIDPTQAITILWSVSYTDPSVIDLKLSNSDSDADLTLATGVVSYTGTYIVPAGTIPGSGSGYVLVAVGNGATLAQVAGLSLGDTGDQNSAIADVTLISTQTVVPTPAGPTTLGATDDTSRAVPTASIDSVGVTTLSGTAGESQFVASIARTDSSFVTSTASRTSISSSSATATAGSTNTASGQRRLDGELVLGAAGIVAGIVALLA
ncbi:hypothetical protein G647_00259 [Cladophialophora carrionii CBS 160.54]|uniref:Yeast cell wall synthesis Kre9/Knh1-like N-terminal domain-containing protein n=1 Tax=Cladophialophora carrionii CBS 160.54 TaxID=1279043 RepID=V9DLS6_9EURO|nr:uncharacterized protein G647_00259 [Cladophialophora carrionii CBS 160.54]ETI27810.1 hypothetical protein G647_00259 [Cladophialophora carrionii CBS 160.54]